ncbi:MAG: ADOP family duplicated permease [Pontimonas sp.]
MNTNPPSVRVAVSPYRILVRSVRDLGQIRYTLRSLWSTRLLSAVAVLTIALGVGLTTTTFSVVYSVLVAPLPFPGAGRLMAVELTDLEARRTVDFEALDLRDFREWQTSFEGLEGYYEGRVNLANAEGYVQPLAAAYVTAGALDLLGVRPSLGRTFLPGEDFTADIRHVVLGHAVWQERFGGSVEVIGTTVQVDGRGLEVVGVMPAGFEFPTAQQLWLPMAFDLPTSDRGSGRSFFVFGRLKEGIGVATANTEARAVARRLSAENTGFPPSLGGNVHPFHERHLPGGIAPILQVMLAAVFGVLVIACANVANLLLVRSLGRTREVSIRSALGATRRRIAQQFLMESLVLSAVGCLLGLGLTAIGLEVIDRSLVNNSSLPYWVEITLATPALVLTAGLVLLVALAAGSLPAVRAAMSDPARALKGNFSFLGRSSPGNTGRRLVTLQIALSCALLIGSGLLLKSLIYLRTLDMGYDSTRVMVASLSVPPSEYPQSLTRATVLAEVVERASALPGVRGASLARGAPGTGPTFSWDFEVRGEDYPSGTYPLADGVPVAHDYFRVMGIEILLGRDFTPLESRLGTEPALIVNETLARRHLGSDPIGRQMRVSGGEGPWLTVVGVVEDTYIGSRNGGIDMDESSAAQIYVSWGVAPYPGGALLVSSERDPEQLIPEVRALVREVGPNVSMSDGAALSDLIADSTWAFSLFGTVFAVFGGVALLMSAVGLYGVIAFSVNKRRPEMSVRIAMGADSHRIMGLVLGEAGRRLLWGTGLGLLLGLLLAQGIRASLYGVGVVDLLVYTVVLVVVIGTGVLAAFLPAYRAAQADPLSGLRR